MLLIFLFLIVLRSCWGCFLGMSMVGKIVRIYCKNILDDFSLYDWLKRFGGVGFSSVGILFVILCWSAIEVGDGNLSFF